MRFVKNGGAFFMSVDSAVLKFYHFEEGKCMLWEEKKRKKKRTILDQVSNDEMNG